MYVIAHRDLSGLATDGGGEDGVFEDTTLGSFVLVIIVLGIYILGYDVSFVVGVFLLSTVLSFGNEGGTTCFNICVVSMNAFFMVSPYASFGMFCCGALQKSMTSATAWLR